MTDSHAAERWRGHRVAFVLLGALVEGTRNAEFRRWVEQPSGLRYTQVLERNAVLLEFLLARGDQARRLLRSV